MGIFGRRKAAKQAAIELFRARRHYLRDDVTAFGEQLSELHVDTLATPLDGDTQDVYRHALESYERAKAALRAAEDADGLGLVVIALVEGRYQAACVLATSVGGPMPQRLPECFFNPQHGPSSITVRWTPPGGTEREVAVCASDANRLARGEDPAVRMVRVDDRWVPFFGGHRSSYFPVLVDPDAINNGAGHARGQAMRYGWTPTGGEGAVLRGNTAGFGGEG